MRHRPPRRSSVSPVVALVVALVAVMIHLLDDREPAVASGGDSWSVRRSLPDRPAQIELTIARCGAGAYMVTLVAEDDCGPWRTLVGTSA